jgi:hypothetical protein
MQRSPDELHLNESYHFDVTVENNGTCFVGELSLTPQMCTLIIRGDILEGRQPIFDMDELSDLACDCFGGRFLLLGLKGDGFSIHHIVHHPKPVSHFEIKYKISHAIYGRAILSKDIGFTEIEFDSRSIDRWVGYTHTQDDIVNRYLNGTLFPFMGVLPTEFECALNSIGILRIIYHPSTHHSIEGFSMGLRFPPTLSMLFNCEKTSDQTIENVNELKTLLSFLIGGVLDLSTIKLTTGQGRMHSLSLYFSHAQAVAENREYPWFPLSRNLRVDTLGLPEFPLESLGNYFGLPPGNREYFKKYIKYREMRNPEERFLGFFRLLEKLCFQKESFLPEGELSLLITRVEPFLARHFCDAKNVKGMLGRVIKLNQSKLNTAGCIARFIKKIPPAIRARWIYGVSDIEAICNLRNDLTHANEIEPEELDIDKKEKFIEVLLLISLLVKIGVSIDVAASIAPRIKGHQLIEKPPKVAHSTSDAG